MDSYEVAPKLAPADREVAGPFDNSEISNVEKYVKFNSIWIPLEEGMSVNLELENETKRVVSVTVSMDSSSLQVQAFASSRSEGLWQGIQQDIMTSVKKQLGTVEIINSTLGSEVLASIPVKNLESGRKSFKIVRFVGVDGPRWFLRGVFSGEAAIRPEKASALEKLFRKIIVSRGENPMPPKELLPLTIPKGVISKRNSES